MEHGGFALRIQIALFQRGYPFFLVLLQRDTRGLNTGQIHVFDILKPRVCHVVTTCLKNVFYLLSDVFFEIDFEPFAELLRGVRFFVQLVDSFVQFGVARPQFADGSVGLA